MSDRNKGGNLRTGLLLSSLVAGMVGLSFAAVPLYQIFCQVTGYGGTTQRVGEGSVDVLERQITVRFNADTDRNLSWYFRPEQQSVHLNLGEQALVHYKAKNLADKALTGTAIFNVTPEKAGQYFNKVECFCFTKQVLKPGQSVDMPIVFYVDPRLNDDPSLEYVETITLSYTFYEAEEPKAKPQDTAELSVSSLPLHGTDSSGAFD